MAVFYMNPYLVAAAIIPAVVLLIRIYRADRSEKEPAGLLLSLILYGIIATALAIATERAGMMLLPRFAAEGTVEYNALQYFIVVAVSEEGFKYLLLRYRTWNDPAFNYTFDGEVYAVFVSLGFALWENIGYVAMYGMSTALVRAVTAVPGHACFGVFMGAWYGAAKLRSRNGRRFTSRLCSVMAFVLPVLLHGCYDFAASMSAREYAWVFYVFITVMFVAAFRLVRRSSAADRRIS